MKNLAFKTHLVVLAFFILVCFSACQTRPASASVSSLELEQLTEWMSGQFSSAAQSERDTSFFSITLTMVPIWEANKDAKWLYVEQAVTKNLVKPYRQRVYKVTQLPDRSFESKVYELPDPEKFIQAWDSLELFTSITPKNLVEREGCSVFLKKVSGKEYSGSTLNDNCKSTLYGANYATSKVQVFKDKIISWDQGWDLEENQIWGAETEGYIFDRLN